MQQSEQKECLKHILPRRHCSQKSQKEGTWTKRELFPNQQVGRSNHWMLKIGDRKNVGEQFQRQQSAWGDPKCILI